MDNRKYLLCEKCRTLWATICRRQVKRRRRGLPTPKRPLKRRFCRACTRIWYVRYTAKYRMSPEAKRRIRAYNSWYRMERYYTDEAFRKKVLERAKARRKARRAA